MTGPVGCTLCWTARREEASFVDLLLAVLVSWLVLSVLGVLGTAAVCRAGHVEDMARGFTGGDPDPAPPPGVTVPSPRGEEAPEVTRG